MIYSRQYCFAGVSIRIDSEAPLDEYLGLSEFGTAPAEADHRIEVRFTDALPEPDAAGVGDDGTQRRRLKINGAPGVPDKEYAVMDSGDKLCRITALSEFREKLDAATVLRTVNFNHIMLRHGAVVLHSSFVLYMGRAILFCAPSGTGKSTQADLWAEHRGAEIINGDRTLLRRTDGKFTANGVYYAGTSGICKNASAPLAAIVLLGQAKENRVCEVSGTDAFLSLFRQSAYSKAAPGDPGLAAELLADAAAKLPIIRLDCLPDESAVEALEKFMEERDIFG